jgi:CheY-like chemotaxis protein
MDPDGSIAFLIIDGDDVARRRSVELVKQLSPDYEVFEAADGRSALARCHTRTFGCIFLELNLPDMSGFEVLGQLVPNACHPTIPVIILTKCSSECLMMASIMHGARAWLQKSDVCSEHLGAVITNAIASMRAHSRSQGYPLDAVAATALVPSH